MFPDERCSTCLLEDEPRGVIEPACLFLLAEPPLFEVDLEVFVDATTYCALNASLNSSSHCTRYVVGKHSEMICPWIQNPACRTMCARTNRRISLTVAAPATLMLTAGVNPKAVSERLGRASAVITLDTYSHVLPSMQEDAAR